MSASIITGPSIVTGNINPTQNTESDAAPSLATQGSGFLDPRYATSVGSNPQNKIFGIYTNSYVACTDSVSTVATVGRIAAAAATVAGTAMVLTTAQGAGISINVPTLPLGLAPTALNLVNTMAMDFGFCPGATNGTTTLTIPAGAWRYFYRSQRLLVAGGNGTGSAGNLYTTVAVTPVPGATTIIMADAATATNALCQVGTAHPILNCAWVNATAGITFLFDPTQAICRAVAVTGNAGSLAMNFTVRGYDIYGQAMTEVIAFAGGAVQTKGRKAFKYIASVIPSVTDSTHAFTIDTTDTIGINIRSDFWEYMNVFVAGTFISVNTGWLPADATLPVSGLTGDVRGTYALQTASNWDGTVANWQASRRTAIFTSLPMYNAINANNLNFSTMFGNTNFAG